MSAVFRHEIRSYFTTPVGYVFLAMYALLAGVIYVFVNITQEMSASINLTLSVVIFVILSLVIGRALTK